jgi:hypothetical protein
MTTLTGLALYSALSEQVYRRSYASVLPGGTPTSDQPIFLAGDGSGQPSDITGWSLVDPQKLNLNQSEFSWVELSGDYIYDTATGFVGRVARNWHNAAKLQH